MSTDIRDETPSAPRAPAADEVREPASEVLDVPRSNHEDVFEKAWRFFCSVKLMVVLMALFAVTMALNTFINPQEDALANIERAFADRPWVVTLYRVFELYAPFKSWWFTLIILLLALNNLASSIERLPRIFLIVRHPELRLTDRVLRGLRNKREAPRGTLDAERVQGELEKGGYRVRRTVEDGVTYLFGERGAWTRFGVWVVHLALLVVCFGGIVGRFFSYEGVIELPEGGGSTSHYLERMADGTILKRPLGHLIRCDDFHLDRFKDGAARRFASDLSILDVQGNELLKKKIIVNDPLHYGGRTFYQATYSERPDQSRAKLVLRDLQSGEKKSVTAGPQEPFHLGDGSVRYSVVNYEPDFQKLGPAVQILREEGPPAPGAPAGAQPARADAKTSTFWVFANHPDFDAKQRGDRFGLAFEGLEPLYVTGLQVGHDPGVFWINLGCLLMFAGLFVTFWTAHRRVWARIEGDRVVLAGAAHRNKDRFKQEFDALLGRLGLASKESGKTE